MTFRSAWHLAVVVVLALAASGCSSETGRADGDAQRPVRPVAGGPAAGAMARVRTFALALGVEPLDRAAVDRLGAYDLVVVDGGATSARQVAALHDQGALVLGYLSVGTVEPYRPWFRDAKRKGWLLDRWPDWNEWYADVGDPGFHKLMVDEARRELGRGFDGLFLDNTDMVSSHPKQRTGMTDLVGQLDTLVGKRLLFAQNGDTTVGDIARHLDGWNREDVSSTYDFDTKRYTAVSAKDHASAVVTLRRLRSDGLFVTATDYATSAGDPMSAKAVDAACAVGAIPFVSDIDLRRVAADPPTCA